MTHAEPTAAQIWGVDHDHPSKVCHAPGHIFPGDICGTSLPCPTHPDQSRRPSRG